MVLNNPSTMLTKLNEPNETIPAIMREMREPGTFSNRILYKANLAVEPGLS